MKTIGRDDCLAMRRLCLSASLRRTERLVTRHYDAYLAESGVSAVQLPILAAIAGVEETTFRLLSNDLELDRSTLSRNLAHLEKHGLLTIGEPSGPKPGIIALTAKGNETLRRAHRLWREAHRALEEVLSETAVSDGLRFLRKVRGAVGRKSE